MTMTPDRLAELRRLHEAATPGPWKRELRDQQHVDSTYYAMTAGGKVIFDTCNSEAFEHFDSSDEDGPCHLDIAGNRNLVLVEAMCRDLPALLSLAERAIVAECKYSEWRGLAEMQASAIAALEAECSELRRLLTELHALVQGESPRLLDEDCGGDGQLALNIAAKLGEAKP